MKKRIFQAASILLLVLSLCISAVAVEARLTTARPTLSFDGTTANCSVTITAAGKEIDATLELWRGGTLIAAWTGNNTTMLRISGEYEVNKGSTYTLTVTGTVDGEEISSVPVTRTCS